MFVYTCVHITYLHKYHTCVAWHKRRVAPHDTHTHSPHTLWIAFAPMSNGARASSDPSTSYSKVPSTLAARSKSSAKGHLSARVGRNKLQRARQATCSKSALPPSDSPYTNTVACPYELLHAHTGTHTHTHPLYGPHMRVAKHMHDVCHNARVLKHT